MKRELRSQVLFHINNINDCYEDINRGGCGVFAYALYHYLYSKGERDLGIVYIHHNPIDFVNTLWVKNGDKHPSKMNGAFHVAVKWGNRYYDSYGEFISLVDLIEEHDLEDYFDFELEKDSDLLGSIVVFTNEEVENIVLFDINQPFTWNTKCDRGILLVLIEQEFEIKLYEKINTKEDYEYL